MDINETVPPANSTHPNRFAFIQGSLYVPGDSTSRRLNLSWYSKARPRGFPSLISTENCGIVGSKGPENSYEGVSIGGTLRIPLTCPMSGDILASIPHRNPVPVSWSIFVTCHATTCAAESWRSPSAAAHHSPRSHEPPRYRFQPRQLWK